MAMKERRPAMWIGFLVVLGAIFCFVPLFDVLGYEFSAVIGTFAGVGTGTIGVGVVHRTRERKESLSVGRLFVRAWTAGLLTLVLPLVFILANAIRVKNCDILTGLAFYAAIPGVSVTYGAGVGTFFGLVTRTSRRGTLLWIAWLLGSVGLALFHLIREPPKFLYHPLFGFVPGPLYDEEVTLTGKLLLAQGMSLLTTTTFLTAAWTTYHPQTQRLSLSVEILRQRRFPLGLTLLGLGVLGVGETKAGALGIRPTRQDLWRVLDGRYETPHFVFYFERGASTESEIQLFAQDAEFRYDQLICFFGLELRRKVGIYLYTSPEQKRHWIGAANTSLADPVNDEIHLNLSEFPHPTLKHELAHLFAGEFHSWIKLSPAIGLLEGVAVAADWDDGRLTVHQGARAMQRLGILPETKRLMKPWGFWGESASRAYTAAGSFCRWLIETYGMASFARLYPTANFQRVYGKSLRHLDDEWKAFLQTVPLSESNLREVKRRFQQKSLFQKTCAHTLSHLEEEARRRYTKRDYRGARSFYERILALEPKNPHIRWRLVQTDIAAGEWRRVRQTASALAEDPQAGDLFRLLAQEALADANWRLGDPESAREGFEAVLRANYSPELNRRVFVKREALRRSPIVQRFIRDYFDPHRADLRLYRLRELIGREPRWALGHYLLGRALLDAQEWNDALNAFERSEKLGLPNRNFRLESARGRGVALYRLGSYRAAAKAFAEAIALAETEGERLAFQTWQERTLWASRQSS